MTFRQALVATLATALASHASAQCSGTDYTTTAFDAAYVPRAAAHGDLDGDGDPDVVVANSQLALTSSVTNHISVLASRGDGALYPPVSFAAGTNPRDLALGDLDGDGALDAVVVNQGYYNYGADHWELFGLSVLLGDGAGGFGTAVFLPFPTGHAEPTAVELADLDGDGDLDAAVAVANAGYLKSEAAVLLNDGAGGLGAPTFFPVGLNPVDLALGDLNGDGAQDLVTVNYFDDTMTVLAGVGDGSFVTVTILYAATYPQRVALGDLDGDGDLDLTLTQKYGVRLYGNVGGFGFPGLGSLDAGLRPNALALSDLDQDGDLDLAVGHLLGDSVGIYIGDGTGGFSPPTTTLVGDAPNAIVSDDLDADGDNDLVVVGLYSEDATVFANACAQPALTVALGELSASAGGTETFQLDAGPTAGGLGYWVVGSYSGTQPGFAAGAVHVPLNVDGYLLLTINAAGTGPFVGTIGTLDGAGTGTAQLVVGAGAYPALVGLTFHHAWVGYSFPTPLFASNAVSLRFVP